VPRLINPKLSAARQHDVHQQTPGLVLYWTARNVLALHVGDERVDVIAHEEQLVDVVLVGWMHGYLRRLECKDQPSAAHVDVCQSEHIAQERAVSISTRAVDDGVRADDHLTFSYVP